ncbi:MFS transporter [Mariniluteicoccus flavus]
MSSTINVGPAVHGDRPARPKGFGRVMAGSMVGAVLEWYDFALFAVLAATVFGPLFFKSPDPIVATLQALGTMGLGFVARPLGGIVFGHLGDKFGRQPMLVVTFLLLGVATAAIGFLPTLASAGVMATVLLVTLRLVQGFALGGEFGAAVLLVSEYGEREKRGFWASWPQAGAPLGTVLATVVVTVLQMIFPGQAFLETGWRVAFWLAIPLLAFGYWIRHGIEESPVFKEAQKAAADKAAVTPRSSIIETLAKPRALLHGLGVRLGENIAFYFYTVFVLSFATKVHKYAMPDVLKVVTLGSVAQFCGMILVAVGRTNQQIAAELTVSPHTVHRHVANILIKLDVNMRAGAAGKAITEALI